MTTIVMPQANRIALAGDWHGNGGFASKAIRAARTAGAEGILQLGDFGIWPGKQGQAYLKEVSRTLKDVGMWLAFIDGNHEDHWQLNELPIDERGVRPVADHIVHLPRGSRWTWHDRSWLALGGATSLDRKQRIIGRSWWPEEAITTTQGAKVMADGRADYMITHDAPIGAAVPGLNPSLWDRDELARAEVHRTLLQRIVEEVEPSHLWHGHMHVKYRTWLPVGIGCEVRGLGDDGCSLADNLMVIELASI